MIGILNQGLLTLSKYHKIGLLNLRNYLPSSSSLSIIKPLKLPSTTRKIPPTTTTMGNREMCKYVKPISRRAKNFQTSDGVPSSYEIIYTSFEYHTISQYGSAGLSILYTIFGTLQIFINYDDIFSDFHSTMIHLWVSALFLYINIGTAVISYKSPVRIYHNKETGDYKAVFNALKPFEIRTIEFKRGMVERIPPADILTLFRFCRFKINEQELYLFDMYFRYPADFYGMFDDGEEFD